MAIDFESLAEKFITKAFNDVSGEILKDRFPNLLREGYFTLEELRADIKNLCENHKAGEVARQLGALYLMEKMVGGK
ncbi:MAG: hypothetical protein MPK05_07860 [Gammaproteobacteria bacterium]|nr:hypothetical protein [Gammaproteobacteria bacterium]